jgi:hypothetical protein
METIGAKDRADLEDTFRKTFAQVVAGIGAAGALYFTFQSSEAARKSSDAAQEATETARETQITQEYAKAVEQLGTTGSDKLAVRLGGIYALERIANGSAKDHATIIEVLTAYIRDVAPWPPKPAPSEQRPAIVKPALGTSKTPSMPKPAADVQAILTVLGRRRTDYEKSAIRPLGSVVLNLSRTDLRGANLTHANLASAWLNHTNLIRAVLDYADLSGAHLSDADLSVAVLAYAHLSGADLMGAHLQNANLFSADLGGADLGGADLGYADLRGADLSGADLGSADLSSANLSHAEGVSQDQINAACGDNDTKLPEALTRPPPCPADKLPGGRR